MATKELRFKVATTWGGEYSAESTYDVLTDVVDPNGTGLYRSLVANNVGNPLTDTSKWAHFLDLTSVTEAKDLALEIGAHPTFVGEDFYVYTWNTANQRYEKTTIYVKGEEGDGITSIVQTTTSSESEGVNIITITKTDGNTVTFQVKNGARGEAGYSPIPGPNGNWFLNGVDLHIKADYSQEEAQRQQTFQSNESSRSAAFTEAQQARQTAFATEQTNRQTAFATEQSSRQTLFQEEQAARSSAFSTEQSTRQQSFETEQASRSSSFTQEQTIRSNAFATEQTNRGTAFTQEQSDRQTAFNTQLNDQETEFNNKQDEIDQAVETLNNSAATLNNLQTEVTRLGPKIFQEKTTQTALTWIKESQIYTAASVGSVPSLSIFISATTRYIDTPCSEGDVFIVNAQGMNSPRLWCFLDSDNKVLAISDAGALGENLQLTAPANSARFIVNDKLLTGICYKVTTETISRIDNLEEQVGKFAKVTITRNFAWTYNKQIYTAASVGSVPALTVYEGDSISTRCIDADCSGVTSVVINGTGMNSPRLWCFLSSDNQVVSISDASVSATDLKLDVPSGAVRLIVNDSSLDADAYCSYTATRSTSAVLSELISEESSESEPTMSARMSPCKSFGTQPAADGTDGSFMSVSDGYDNLIALYDQLVTDHPNNVTKVSIGYDSSGEIETFAYVFAPKYYKQIIILQAGVHAGEVTAIAALARIMQLIYSDTEDEDLCFLRQNCKFVVIPCMNPWGYPTTNSTYAGVATQTWDADTCVETVNARTFLAQYAATAAFMIDMHTTGGGSQYLDFYGNMQRDGKNLAAIFRANEWLCDHYALDGNTVSDQLLGYVDNMALCRYYMHKTYGLETSTMEFSDDRFYSSRTSSDTITLAVTMWLNYIIQQANDFYKVIEQDVSADLKTGLT